MREATIHPGVEEIVLAARRQARSGGVILAFANWRYLDVLMNWLVALSLHGIENYLIVALDRKLHEFLMERAVPTVLSELDGDLSSLWRRRIEVFAALCEAGVDFVHSDVDAIWMRDPRARFLDGQDADLVISQGTVWPPDVHQRFGFVLCCGLFKLKGTALSRSLLSELSTHVLSTGDDQISLNRLIAQRTPKWQFDRADLFHVAGPGVEFLCSQSMILGTCADGLRVAVLPHRLFQRVPLATSEMAYVKHLLTPKDAAAKLQEFARQGCLFLRPDWRQYDFDANSLSKLRREN